MRVERSFGFIDLCGFTAFTDQHGDEQAVEVLGEFRRSVRRLASDFGVRIAKWIGDGAMFVAVDPEPLIMLVLELEQLFAVDNTPLALRAGMSSGAVILFEGDDHIGRAVNLASRLCDKATPGECLATLEIAKRAPDLVVAEPVGAVEVPGFSRPVDVARLAFASQALPTA